MSEPLLSAPARALAEAMGIKHYRTDQLADWFMEEGGLITAFDLEEAAKAVLDAAK